MTRITLAAWATITALVGFGAGRATAQQPVRPPGFGTTGRPAFSPYLNMNLAGNPAALNYYGIVRPQFQARAEFQSLEQQAAANRQAIAEGGAPASALPTTGHPVAFQNLGGYFMNLNPVQGGTFAGGTGFGGGGGGFGSGGGYSFGGMGVGSMQGGARPGGGGLGGGGGFQAPGRRR